MLFENKSEKNELIDQIKNMVTEAIFFSHDPEEDDEYTAEIITYKRQDILAVLDDILYNFFKDIKTRE